MATEEVDLLEAEQEQRLVEAMAAEQSLIDHLEAHGAANLWDKMRDRVHCQAFLKSRTGKRVTDRLVKDILSAQTEWLLSENPASREMIERHRQARISHAALFLLDDIISEGGEAEQEIERINRENS